MLFIGGNTYSSNMPLRGSLAGFTGQEDLYFAAYNTSGFIEKFFMMKGIEYGALTMEVVTLGMEI